MSDSDDNSDSSSVEEVVAEESTVSDIDVEEFNDENAEYPSDRTRMQQIEHITGLLKWRAGQDAVEAWSDVDFEGIPDLMKGYYYKKRLPYYYKRNS